MLSALFGLEAEGTEAALLSYPIAVERKTVFNLSPWHVHVFSVLDSLALGLHQTFLHGAGVDICCSHANPVPMTHTLSSHSPGSCFVLLCLCFLGLPFSWHLTKSFI